MGAGAPANPAPGGGGGSLPPPLMPGMDPAPVIKKNGRVSRFDQTSDPFADRKRRKKSRWGGGEEDKTFIPGMPTMLPQGLNKDQEEAYLRKLSSIFRPCDVFLKTRTAWKTFISRASRKASFDICINHLFVRSPCL